MINFLIVYKHNTSPAFMNKTMFFDGAPTLSEIQLSIMKDHNWKLEEFSIVNIIPIRTELKLN